MVVFIIGIDPHKASHTAAVIDGDEQLVAELSVRADRRARERLLVGRWRSSRGCGRWKGRRVSAPCWLNSW
jgi:hypothetical protein